MSRYFTQADFPELNRAFPIGDAFLSGPAQFDPERLRALQEDVSPVSLHAPGKFLSIAGTGAERVWNRVILQAWMI